MAKLIFLDDNHEYRVGNEILPSVSEILRFLTREMYDSVSQYTLDQAADRGKRVHKATENLDRYGEVQVDNDIVPYVQAYVKFCKDYCPQWTRIEYACYHPEMMFAGTFDRYGTINGEQYLVDIKTTATRHKLREEAQLCGYQKLAEANGLIVHKRAILQLRKDGTYKLDIMGGDDTLFMACYQIHMATRKGKRKKK